MMGRMIGGSYRWEPDADLACCCFLRVALNAECGKAAQNSEPLHRWVRPTTEQNRKALPQGGRPEDQW